MHSNRELKKLKRVRALVRELLLNEGSAATATAERALKYNLAENERVLRRIKPLVNCPSGILLNIPTSVPGRVISWMSPLRIYEVYIKRAKVYQYYVCFDDLSRMVSKFGNHEALSKVQHRGFAKKHDLGSAIDRFASMLARIVKVKGYVQYSRRQSLAGKLYLTIWRELEKWAEEHGGLEE